MNPHFCYNENCTWRERDSWRGFEARIGSFEPVAGTVTHVLLDTWYSAKCLWRAARERGFLITTGLKSNRWLRVEDPTAPQGWRWQKLTDYTAQLSQSDYRQRKLAQGRR